MGRGASVLLDHELGRGRGTLHETCPYSELFCSVFFRICTKYGETLRISPYSVRMRENSDHNNPEYGNFWRSGSYINFFYNSKKNFVGFCLFAFSLANQIFWVKFWYQNKTFCPYIHDSYIHIYIYKFTQDLLTIVFARL